MNLNQKLAFSGTVFAQEVDGEMVLLDMESENYFGLDEEGTVIWQTMQERETLQEVLKAYEVEAEVLKKDLSDFVGKFLESGLVEVKEN